MDNPSIWMYISIHAPREEGDSKCDGKTVGLPLTFVHKEKTDKKDICILCSLQLIGEGILDFRSLRTGMFWCEESGKFLRTSWSHKAANCKMVNPIIGQKRHLYYGREETSCRSTHPSH